MRNLAKLSSSAVLTLLLASGTMLPAIAQETQPAATDTAGLYEAAKTEGSLVWYTTTAQDLSVAMAKKFSDAYPGVNVEVIRILDAQQYQRYVEETAAGQYIADIVNISDRTLMSSIVDEGYLAEWKLPTYDQFSDKYKIGAFATSFAVLVPAILYNENKVTPEEAALLENWTGILDPRFKGRIATVTQRQSNLYAGLQAIRSVVPDFDDFLAKFAAQEPVVYNDLLSPVDRVVVGENDIYFWGWEAIAGIRRASGAPIRWVYPKPTPAYGGNYYGVSKFAPHPNASRLFLNWMGSEEGAVAVQQIYAAMPTMDGAKDVRAFISEDWYKPLTDVYDVDYTLWLQEYEAVTEQWEKAIGSR